MTPRTAPQQETLQYQRFGVSFLSSFLTVVMTFLVLAAPLRALADDSELTGDVETVAAPTPEFPRVFASDPKIGEEFRALSIREQTVFWEKRSEILALVDRLADKTNTVAAVGYFSHRVRRVFWARPNKPTYGSLAEYRSHNKENLIAMADRALWLNAKKLVASDEFNLQIGARLGFAMEVGTVGGGRFTTLGVQISKKSGHDIVAGYLFAEIEKFRGSLLKVPTFKIFKREFKNWGFVFDPSVAIRTHTELRVSELSERRRDGEFLYFPAMFHVTVANNATGVGVVPFGLPLTPPFINKPLGYKTEFTRWVFPIHAPRCVDIFTP